MQKSTAVENVNQELIALFSLVNLVAKHGKRNHVVILRSSTKNDFMTINFRAHKSTGNYFC